jgi:radical SAM superfamily enzyme YgiQ (UPF0313 family)
MKILLIQPPIRDFYRTSIRTQPIGLAYLASSLKVSGYEVEILDCQTGKKRQIPVSPELSYLQDLYPFHDLSPFKLYTGYYHFGMDWDEIRQKVIDSGTDVFGISSSFTPYHREALEIARIIKEWDASKVTIMGGSHPSCDPDGVLKSPFVDYVIMGEGEIRLPILLKEITKGRIKGIEMMDGIGYRANGRIKVNGLKTFIQDLDSLSYPARELLELDQYRIKRKRSTMIITSRGCPHGCAYCSSHVVMGSSYRKRAPEAILGEMVNCYKRHGITVFDVEDDNFTFDQVRTKRLMELIIDAFGEGFLELYAMNGISFASLNGEILKLMKRAGFRTIGLSYVSTDTSFKERMGRPSSAFDFDGIFKEAEEIGFHVTAYAIFGIPGQTIHEMVDTLIYLMGKRVLIGPSIYYPVPGTPLFEKCKMDNILPSHASQWRSSALPIETGEFKRLDLVTILRLARLANFIKGKVDRGELEEGVSWKELRQIVKEKKTRYHDMHSQDSTTWMDLVLQVLEERSFFSLRKNSAGELSIIKEKTSRAVMDNFYEKAWGKSILKSQPSPN